LNRHFARIAVVGVPRIDVEISAAVP